MIENNYPFGTQSKLGKAWNEAYGLALIEEHVGKSPIPVEVEEIARFAAKIAQATNHENKYRLLMERTKRGELWYDVLLGRNNADAFKGTLDEIRKQRPWDVVVDVGTGTGNTLKSIAPFAKRIYGVDFSDFALKAARDSGLPKNSMVVVGRAGELPIASNSADLITENGLILYLSVPETIKFIVEMRRVLKPGGKYFLTLPTGGDREISIQRILLGIISTDIIGSAEKNDIDYELYGAMLMKAGLRPTKIYEKRDGMVVEHTKV